jgi:hypothetical protein
VARSGFRGWWWPRRGVGAVTMSGVCGSVVGWASFGWLCEVAPQKLGAKAQPGSCRPAAAAPMSVVFLIEGATVESSST